MLLFFSLTSPHISAKTEPALRQLATKFREYLKNKTPEQLCDLSHTAMVGRNHFNHRLAVVGSSTEEVSLLQSTIGKTAPNVANLFSVKSEKV